jgi:asparagine synthase (glutamine-hydrolysing)
MCGIFGIVNTKKVNRETAEKALNTLVHRGPDAGAYYTDPQDFLFLGHRRLSIIDLSAVANQPMHSACGRYVMVYNGEVYNYRQLKSKLPGFAWQTHGDSEVILELFAFHGTEVFSWLNGFFAIAIFDKETHQLYISRDQLGIKPLFIQRTATGIAFASELKALVALHEHPPAIHRPAVAAFLHLGYIPQPDTIYQGIEKFPAAHFAVYDTKSHSFEKKEYWRAADYLLKTPVKDEQQALSQYRDILASVIERQMISDVPLGTFLSGGIDSSLVSAMAAEISNRTVNTFSIGFDDAQYDESVYASAVAEHLGTEHHLFRVKQDDVLELLPQFMQVYDEPFADSSAFPTMLVSRLAKQHVTVTLSGDGGDELFQGYGMYAWAKRLHHPAFRLLRKPLYQLSSVLNERYQRAGTLFNYPDLHHLPSHIFSQEQYLFSVQELELLLDDVPLDFYALNQLPDSGNPQERQAFWDIGHYLKDDLLVKVDRASMYYSLETRVPLLDKEIVEFALNLPLKFKVSDELGTKHLMKKLLYQMVPRAIFDRPKKGFAIPLKKWLNHELKPLREQYLNETSVREAGFVRWEVVARLIKEYEGGKAYLYNRIWVLLVLHWWFKQSR